jgi:hypothetical protein
MLRVSRQGYAGRKKKVSVLSDFFLDSGGEQAWWSVGWHEDSQGQRHGLQRDRRGADGITVYVHWCCRIGPYLDVAGLSVHNPRILQAALGESESLEDEDVEQAVVHTPLTGDV